MERKIHRPHLSTASDPRAVRTREALHRAMLELLETRPLDQITILDICAAAGVSYTTFFRHHPSKESLLDHLAAAEIGRLVALTLPVINANSVSATSETLFAYVDTRRKLWTTLLTGGAAGALRAELLRLAMEIAATRTRPRAWAAAEVATRVYVSGTIEILTWWLQQSKPQPVAKVAELHERIVALPIIGSQRVPAPLAAKKPTAKRAASGAKNRSGK